MGGAHSLATTDPQTKEKVEKLFRQNNRSNRSRSLDNRQARPPTRPVGGSHSAKYPKQRCLTNYVPRYEESVDTDMGRTFGNKNLTDNDKRAIVVGRQNGLTMMTLAGMFGVTKAGISQFLKRQKAQDGSTNSQRTGRPRVTDRNDDRNILKTSRTNPRLTAPAIRREVFLNSPSPPSVSTVKRRLNAAGIMGRRPKKKPLISEKNRVARVKLEQDSVVRRNGPPPCFTKGNWYFG
ncbi:unnamed protein product [Caenorhabditis auriculariae]|uniref:Transposase Tc1-like domain-containing protein n=1 Tax=Caenorhabditis auriculariae TaxID=2777116 RepID=A0A8S1HFY9_9PELO|nr:unnamed protein product [Caenorhabditis auriculariae]